MLNPIQRQSLISGAVTLSVTVIGFFSTIYFAHSVGSSVLGLYFIFLAYFSLFNFLGDGGFGGASNKRISEGRDRDALLSAYFSVKLILLALVLVVFFLAGPVLADFQDPVLQVLTALALALSVLSDWAMTGVYGMGKIAVTQVSMLLNNVFRILIQIAAVFVGFGIFGLIGGFIAGMVLGTVVNLHFLDFRFTRFDRSHLKCLSSYAIWSFLSTGGLLIFTYADTLLIAFFLDTADVAIYRTAFNLTAITAFTIQAFQFVLFPKISSWWVNGEVASIRTTVSLSIHFSMALALPYCVGGWILGERLLYFLYGSSFTSGNSAFSILLVVQIINIYVLMLATTLNALNRPSETFKVTFITSLLLILLDILLIPLYGIIGAAVAVLISLLLNALISYRILAGSLTVPLNLRTLDTIVLSSLIMGLVLLVYRFFIPLSNVFVTVLAVITGFIVYSIVLLLCDTRIKSQFQLILNMIS